MTAERDADARRRLRAVRTSLRAPSEVPAPTRRAAPVDDDRLGDISVRARLQERLLRELGEVDLGPDDDDALEAFARSFVERVLDDEDEAVPLNAAERAELVDTLVEEAIGVGPLAPLMADPAVTDVLVNGPRQVYVERFGRLEPTDVRFRDDDHVLRLIERLAARVGRRIDQSMPLVDLRLPDGSRVNATIPPASVDGPTVSIRRFGRRRLRRSDLARLGALDERMLEVLAAAVRARRNIVISGGTGSGKSTLLGALAEAIPDDDRVLTIEDTVELILDQPHVVRLETRPANIEGRGEITIRDLVVNALRMRPTRIVVGECRGPEALDMLQAMNTGHEGGLTTVHSNSARDALARLETMVLMAGVELPLRAIREQIASAVHLVVHVGRGEDGTRRVQQIAEITGLEGETVLMQDVWVHRTGEGFTPTGIVPHFVDHAEQVGVHVSRELFVPGGAS